MVVPPGDDLVLDQLMNRLWLDGAFRAHQVPHNPTPPTPNPSTLLPAPDSDNFQRQMQGGGTESSQGVGGEGGGMGGRGRVSGLGLGVGVDKGGGGKRCRDECGEGAAACFQAIALGAVLHTVLDFYVEQVRLCSYSYVCLVYMRLC